MQIITIKRVEDNSYITTHYQHLGDGLNSYNIALGLLLAQLGLIKEFIFIAHPVHVICHSL